MKCPKCGYLGYERVERCRNCGYEFSLTTPASEPDLRIRDASPVPSPLEDLDLLDSLSRDLDSLARDRDSLARDLESLSRDRTGTAGSSTVRAEEPAPESNGLAELPLFGPPITDDVPLITTPSRPRPPLAVRRATPEVPRVRSEMRTPLLDWPADANATGAAASVPPPTPPPGLIEERQARQRLQQRAAGRTDRFAQRQEAELPPASLVSRGLAIVIDLVVMAVIDVVVIYFTLKICGITPDEWAMLPKAPLAAFLLVQNGGYLIGFTAIGQTIGKLVAGIRVLSDDADAAPDLGRAAIRTFVWVALALPAGLGFLTAAFGRDKRGLHDRFAGTRVVRAGV